jgi:hypothetical protein
MSTDYKIVCVTTALAHSHITSVGVDGTATNPNQTFTVTEVRDKIDKGDKFHTVSPSTEATTYVKKDTCGIRESNGLVCDYKTIRSNADAVTDNNLDYLVTCP